jgi:GT2 family glycosyltransferase
MQIALSDANSATDPSDAPDVSVIVVSYATREMTIDCLQSIYDNSETASFELLVVDNASPDGSAEAIGRRFPDVKVIALDENIGFARANNLAAARAKGTRLLLLNPDTVILDHAIDRIVEFATLHPDAQIYGGRTVFEDGSINATACFARPTLWASLARVVGLASLIRGHRWFEPEAVDARRRAPEQHVDVVTGCFLLIDRDLWVELGGFDEQFFMYGEEVDLCLRARACGANPLASTDIRIIHHGGASQTVREDKLVRLFCGKARIIGKHWTQPSRWFGIRMIDGWALTRAMALMIISAVQSHGAKERQRTWMSVWRRRSEWRQAARDGACQGSTLGRADLRAKP